MSAPSRFETQEGGGSGSCIKLFIRYITYWIQAPPQVIEIVISGAALIGKLMSRLSKERQTILVGFGVGIANVLIA